MEGKTYRILEENPLVDCPIEPPLSTLAMARDSHSICFLAPEQLELIFEMWRDMME